MADTTIELNAPSGLSLTVKLYPHGSDALANGAGDSLVERTNCKGLYAATITEAIEGWHDVSVLAGASVIATGHVNLADDTGTYRVHDPPQHWHAKVDALAELGQAAPSATPAIWDALMLLYMALRNKLTTTVDEYAIHDDAGTKIVKKALADDGTTYTESEAESGA